MTRPRGAVARGWWVLGPAFAVIATLVLGWVALDRRPPEWDHANHLERAVLCAQDLARGDVRTVLERSSFYPPIVPCAAAIVYRVFPSDALAGELVMLAFLALGMAATYLLGRRIGDERVGVAAALLFATAPFVIYSTLRFQLDLPLAAMVALALWLLLATERFTRLAPTLALGAAAGLGMLTKPPFAAYLLPPLAVTLVRVRGRAAWVRLAVATAVAVAIALPWYGPRLAGLPFQVGARSFKQAAESGHPDPMTGASLSVYPRWSPTQFGIVAVLLCLAGLVVAVRRREGVLLAALLGPFAIFELLQNKNLRYTLPLLPIAAVVAALALGALGGRARKVVGALAALAALFQVGATMAGIPDAWTAIPWLGTPTVLVSPPSRDDWKQREILALIVRHSRGAAATVSVVPNAAPFSVSNFRYYALRDGLTLSFVRAWDEVPLGVEYMILKTGDQGPSWTADKPRRIAERFATDTHLARVFPVIGELALPDGSRATVRAREIPPVETDVRSVARGIEEGIRQEMSAFARDVEGFQIVLDGDDAMRRGRVRRLELRAAAASVAEFKRRNAAVLRLHDVRIVVDDLLVNPWSAVGLERFDVLDAGRVTIERATVTAADLAAFLAALREFRGSSVALEEGAARFTVSGHGPTLRARVALLSADDRPFAINVDQLRYGRLPVPPLLVNWIVRNFDPTPRLAARLPVPVRIGRVSVTAGAIHITPVKEVSGR